MNERVSLGELMVSRNGSVDPAKFRQEIFDLYSIPAFDRGHSDLVPGAEIGSTKQVVRPGDVLLSKIVPHIRRAWVVGPSRGNRAIASGEWIVFRSERVHAPYLRHVLTGDSFHTQFMATVAGVGGSLLRARPAFVADIVIALPPMDEQRRIAEVLDRADAMRAKRSDSFALFDDLTRSIFVDMFGDPISNPHGFPLRALKDLGRVVTGRTPNTSEEGIFGGPVPFVTPGDLESGDVPRRTLTLKGAASTVTVRAGSVFVCCIGATIGKTGRAMNTSSFNQQINAVEWGSNVQDDYGFVSMAARKDLVASRGASTTLPIMKKSAFERIEIPVPPIDLQRTFSVRFAHARSARALCERQLAEMSGLFASLQHRAFGGFL